MIKPKVTTGLLLAVAVTTALGLSGCGGKSHKHHNDVVKLRILETSDLHTNIMDYNYYKDDGKSDQSGNDPTIGLARVSNLIKAARKEVDNSVTVDNGDLLQGSPMGDYMADVYKKNDNSLPETHPAYKAMNIIDYDVANIGNHEFNYGLGFLDAALKGAKFPYINSNVICDTDCGVNGKNKGDNRFTPYIIEDKQVKDQNGDMETLKIGYIGFVPPQIMQWDSENLTGKVTANSIIDSANKYVPEMKQKGADIIIAIPHSGMGTPNDDNKMMENAVWALSKVPGIDAIAFGHSHALFPSDKYKDVDQVDITKGTINGVAAVMPGRWGDNLGVIDLTLEKQNGKWKVTDSKSATRPIYDGKNKKALVETDQQIRDAVAKEHAGTRTYVNAPIGKGSSDMFSFLSMAQDDPTVQIVANAEMWYATNNKDAIKNEADRTLPILAAAAPFKAGGRFETSNDADQYVQVAAGDLAFKNAADLYLYPNTMVALKVTGAQVKEWLECSANQFNKIDPASTAPQNLINRAGHPTYNFDTIKGITYKIDVTKPSNYDRDCKIQNVAGGSQRIQDLTYTPTSGDPITGDAFAKQNFIVVTNNYRAFGGKFAGTGRDNVVADYAIENRQVLIDYIKDQSGFDPATGKSSKTINTQADNNWDFVNITPASTLDVRFETQDSDKAATYITANQRRTMNKLDVTSSVPNFAIYSIDMTKLKTQ
ncbi:bifunctional 2',3'-cyclic-nucleotide 2'-phosphodiesterase/3'-nucleotidase [Parashewanella tropica]|uniref:bifunctional 2',3'-cyclic-nucleotide 2'-phosphodiesterase/3'-nucleotidase n=1 Tax=Parashewanella tropica TaxID=2547970 RepID=UPI00105A45F5|nr:bifunctional 2',3'-cyclic-nucleotide 2'-phosphodiesterase/3'-nucleotidase [Parashewanella tropica]